jgi:dihydroxyacetone kinase
VSERHPDEALRAVARVAIDRRDAWDRLDAAAGDGDFGSTIARGFAAALAELGRLDHETPGRLLCDVGDLLSREMGGTSGPLWGVAFRRAGLRLDAGDGMAPALAGEMLAAAIAGIREYGSADVGDKTMLDALAPAAAALERSANGDLPAALGAAAVAAAEGARATRGMHARRGRASYSAERSADAPDAGAVAVAELLSALSGWVGGTTVDLSDLEPAPRTAERRPTARTGTKQFLNRPEDVVTESLEGFALAHADLVVWDAERRIVHRAGPLRPGHVGLISGGGSGHEPMHVGFVGAGMLTAAAPGPVFASPSIEQVLAATLAADAGAGVLHVVKNYTGDVINFRLAAERAEAQGVEVATVLVDDDVSIEPEGSEIGRRGTGATVLVEKIAGACAEAGASLAETRAVAQRVVSNSASFGVALSSCSPPGGEPILELAHDEIEIGVGIHGERGRRTGKLRSAAAIVDEIAAAILPELELSPGAPVLLSVSGLGATTLIEQYLVFRELHERLDRAGLAVARSFVGPNLTALDMAGVCVTVLALEPDLIELWDAPAQAPGWRAPAHADDRAA